MALIFESTHFTVDAVDTPLVDREDGGHVAINPKVRVTDRQQLTPFQAVELMRLTIVAGEAMTTVMNRHGVDIGRINYQDNGNWSVFAPEGPVLHVHLYGRAKSAKVQKYGQATFFPHRNDNPEFYARCNPLTAGDVKEIRNEIMRLLDDEKHSDEAWGLS